MCDTRLSPVTRIIVDTQALYRGNFLQRLEVVRSRR